jgi:membrane protease YdiL (CAAX protease family)
MGNEERTLKKYAIMFGNLLVFIGLYFVIISSVVYLWANVLMPYHPWFVENTLGYIVLNGAIGFPIFYLVFRYIYKRNFFKEARFQKMDRIPVLISIGVGLMAGIFTAVFAQLPLIQSDDIRFSGLFAFLNGSTWYVFLGFLLVGNLFKETLFRGILFNVLRKALPVTVAIIIQGLLYGTLFFNLNPPLTLFGFLGAVVFVLLYIWFDSIWAPILAQIFCQGCQYIIWHSSLQLDGIVLQISIMSITGLLVAAGLYLAWRYQSKSNTYFKIIDKGVQA